MARFNHLASGDAMKALCAAHMSQASPFISKSHHIGGSELKTAKTEVRIAQRFASQEVFSPKLPTSLLLSILGQRAV